MIGWRCTSASWRTPDLTPIEEAFAKLKALLRQAAARTAEALAAAFWAALAAITPADAHGLLKSAVRDPDPVLFLEHKKVYRLVTEEVPDGDHLVPIGPASVRREGKNLSCFAWGLMTHYCLEAAQQLEEDGVSVEVVDLRTLAPLDRDAILASVRKTGKAMVVHEDNLTGGFGAEVAAIISEHAFDSLDGPVVRVAAPDIPAMPFNTPQEDFFMPSPSKIAEAMRKLAAY